MESGVRTIRMGEKTKTTRLRVRGLCALAVVLFILTALLGEKDKARAADAPATVPAASAPATVSPATAPATAPIVQAATGDAAELDLLAKLSDADAAGRKDIFEKLARTGDQRLEQALNDFNSDSLYLWKGRAVSCAKLETEGDHNVAPLIDPLSRQAVLVDGKPARVPEGEIKEISPNRRDRIAVRDALSLLRLSNPDRDARLAAVIKSGEGAVEGNLPALTLMEKTEKDAAVRDAIRESVALIEIAKTGTDADTRATRLAAATTLGEMRSARALGRLLDWRKAETDPAAQRVLNAAIARIQSWQRVVEWCGILFSGLSASSILVLMGLGLAIIFGLMGVINMAHGELMMVGAYATYETQRMFDTHMPGMSNYYFIFAIPMAFVAAALIGMLIESLVIRHLYGRPLDTLLATLGVSYILIWLARAHYGDNIAVNSPSWLQGSWEVMQDVRLPYNRIFIIGFCTACIFLMYFIVDRTRLGLLLRATTQNRPMAASLGVSTRKIDMLTFGLGSGLAGMAGCALTLIGGVTPDMGQNYVIDSFLVVVVGGVGKLQGAIWSGGGLGTTSKLLEPETGAVWAKVLILLLIVAFIQRRPSGLFPAKGRLADV